MENGIKDFLLKGVGLDLSFAVVAGFAMYSALQNIVQPLLNLATGGIDLSGKFLLGGRGLPESLPIGEAIQMGSAITYGQFLVDLWNLIGISIIVYLSFRIFIKLVARREVLA